LARLIVERGWPIARAAERFAVSWPTTKRWADRYQLAGHGDPPNHSPRRTPAPHHYNHHRIDTAIGGRPPITRITNLPDQYT
jgi:transposase-like protein